MLILLILTSRLSKPVGKQNSLVHIPICRNMKERSIAT